MPSCSAPGNTARSLNSSIEPGEADRSNSTRSASTVARARSISTDLEAACLAQNSTRNVKFQPDQNGSLQGCTTERKSFENRKADAIETHENAIPSMLPAPPAVGEPGAKGNLRQFRSVEIHDEVSRRVDDADLVTKADTDHMPRDRPFHWKSAQEENSTTNMLVRGRDRMLRGLLRLHRDYVGETRKAYRENKARVIAWRRQIPRPDLCEPGVAETTTLDDGKERVASEIDMNSPQSLEAGTIRSSAVQIES